MTIAGSVYVASLFFLILAYCYPDLTLESFLSRFHGLLTYIGVAVVALSYILGFIVHRLMQIAISIGINFKKLRSKKLYFDAVRKEVGKRLGDEETIWVSSPPRIHREVDFQFAQLALLRSLALSVPCLFISICIWRLETGQYAVWQSIYWIFFALFYPLLIFAWRRQSLQHKTILDGALERVKAEKSAPTPSAAIVTIKGIRVGETDGNCIVTFDGLKIDPPLVQINKLIPHISPVSGPVGTPVTITGIKFGESKQDCEVSFGKEPTELTSWSLTSIVVPVPKVDIQADKEEVEVDVIVKVVVPDTPGTESGARTLTLQLTCPKFTVTR